MASRDGPGRHGVDRAGGGRAATRPGMVRQGGSWNNEEGERDKAGAGSVTHLRPMLRAPSFGKSCAFSAIHADEGRRPASDGRATAMGGWPPVGYGWKADATRRVESCNRPKRPQGAHAP